MEAMPAPTDHPISAAPGATSVSPTIPAGSRDPLVDALRSVALARVVLWHACAAPWLSWVFPAMPVMFFLAGAVLAGSVTGSRSAGVVPASGLRTLGRRLIRILLPFWVYSAGVVAVTALRPSVFGVDAGPWPALLLPLPQATGTDRDWLTGHLWYLTDYLALLVLLPLAALLARRVGLVIGGALLGLAGLELAPLFGLPSLVGPARMAVGDLLCYGLFAVLGIAWASRRPAPPAGRAVAGRTASGLALVGATVVASAFVPRPRGSLNESYLLLAVAALGWLLLIGAAERPLRRLAGSARVAPAARAVSARALTIYLWHPAAILVALAVAPGGALSGPSVLLLTVALTAVAVAAFGWVEDVAARRPARWWPGRLRRDHPVPSRRAPHLGLVAAAIAGVTLIVGAVSAVTAERTATAVAALPPPSDRTALADTAFAAAAREPQHQDRTTQLRDGDLQTALDQWIAAQPEINDAVVGVAAGSQVWSGSAARADGEPRAADVSVGIASMTKTFTAALAVQVAEEGLLDLDAPVPALPEVIPLPDGGTVTPRQLLQHSSGLIQYTDAPGYDAGRVYTAGELVSLSTQAPLRHLPGAGVTYSNSNYLWLGLLLESVTDSTYGALLADRIAGPLGLPTVDLPVDERTGWVGAASGGVSATPADVARFFDALINRGELLSVDALDRMTDLRQLNGGLGIWPMCPCGEREDGVKWATGLGHFNGDGAAFAFPEDQLAVYLRIGGPGDGPITGERMVLMREELLELMRTTAIRTDGVDH
jgi:CubicO group peptidase (beta-lactamase class C family)/peptidoglycan/LPS O-acetylase OafA/YrhL